MTKRPHRISADMSCVLVGNQAGQVAPGTGNCAELRTKSEGMGHG